MSGKQILYKEEARNAISEGINDLADAVAVTLGPKGRNVLIQKKFGAPQSVRDGVTVAKEIEFEDPVKDIGAKLIREAATKANDKAGDGTTTATVLTRSIINESRKVIAAGANPRDVKRGIEEAVALVIEEIKNQATPVNDRNQIKQVATVAAGNDETIGEMIAEAMDKVGRDGVITVEEAKSLETSLKIVEGMQFDKGFISPYFVTNSERQEVELKDAYVLLCEKKINLVSDLVPILEKVARSGKPLLIIAEDIEGEALATLVVNKLRQVLNVCAVKAPGFGDRRKAILQDIAILTGAEVISEDLGSKLENISPEQLGTIDRVLVTKEETTLVIDIPENRKAAIEGRKKQIQVELEETSSEYDKEKLQERLAKIAGGVATIQIGAATETELKDKKLRVEDAVNATKAACEEGIVPGGGVALIRSQSNLENLVGKLDGDKSIGAQIVLRAIEGPARQIADNAGQEPSIIIQKVKEQKSATVGYNAANDKYEDMLQAGIIDPAKVTRTSLQVASSIACMVIETDAVVYEIPEKEKAAPAMPGPGMGMDY
ncbi:MAG: chaperonin GroEL [Candidatus Caenarcaniphilales bacterium]|nr:chaperonin GroEL [Candidatus Caenarcaniphilales bacterium]